MEFIKTLINNKRLIWQLGKNDFRNKFANTSLGALWGFMAPFVFMITYVIVFQYILKTGSAGSDPYVVWFLPGMSMWMFLNDSITTASNSIINYSYLVKKVVFPIDIIPIISLASSSIISVFLFIISVIVCTLFGYVPNILMLIYMMFSATCFIVAFTRLSSAVTTLVPDVAQLLTIFMQLCFWFTPIIWNLTMVDQIAGGLVSKIVRCMPFTYLVTGFRNVFIEGNIVTEFHGIYTISFWSLTIFIFLWGNSVFKKSKKDFADIL